MSHQMHYVYDDAAAGIHVSVEAPIELYPQVLALLTQQLIIEIGQRIGSPWVSIFSDETTTISGHNTRQQGNGVVTVVESLFGKELPYA